MSHPIALADRLELSARRNARYRSDPDYRLRCINHSRARRGMTLLADLDGVKIRGRSGVTRDAKGRFA